MRSTIRRAIARYCSCLYPLLRKGDVLIGALMGRVHEDEFHHLSSVLPKSAVVIDVGANLGQSITSLCVVARSPNVISFECNPSCYWSLNVVASINKFLRAVSVEVHQVGLAEQDSRQKFLVPAYRSNVFLQEGFIAGCMVDPNEISARIGCKPSDIEFTEFLVDLKTLDGYELVPDLIKIDVQGAELSVLKGARETIDRHKPLLFIEKPDEKAELEKLLAYLADLHYTVSQFSTNLLAVPEK